MGAIKMSNELQATIEFAVKKHSGQTRKNGVLPYISHPFDVLKKVCAWGIKDLNVHKAALVHDLLEDTDTSIDELKSVVGEIACNYVQELTFTFNSNVKSSKKEQKEAYISSFDSKSDESLILKIADRFANIRDFIADEDPYAVKYINQAKDLFQTFKNKKKHLEEKFGKRAIDAIDQELSIFEKDSTTLSEEMLACFSGCVNLHVVKKYTKGIVF
jgi:(p)ppGpp synthase/HD superfamily hydrolase